MVILILILVGLCLGSFVNAFVWRLREQDELSARREELEGKKTKAKELKALDARLADLSISRGRSMCGHCHHTLAPKDLVPVFSYLLLRGKCRYCRARIQDSPLAELMTPVLFVVSYVFWPLQLQGSGLFLFIAWLVFLVGFVILALYDLRWYELPHKVVLPLIALAAVQVFISAFVFKEGSEVILAAFYGALVIGGLFYALYRISHEQWIGFGDVTLGILLGLLVGGPAHAFLLIFIASLAGTLIALPLLATGKATRSTHLPFGPFLMLGAVIVMLFGSRLLAWYTSTLIP